MPIWLLGILTGAKTGLTSILPFISKPPGIYVAGTFALAVGLWWFGQHEFNKGAAANEAKHVAQSAQAQQDIALANADFEVSLKNMAANALAAWSSSSGHITFLVQTQKSEISQHVTPEIDARFPLPCGLWRMHDAARLGVSPSSTASTVCGSDGAVAPAPASVLSGDIFDDWDYTARVETQRDYWRGYALGLLKAWNDYRETLTAANKK